MLAATDPITNTLMEEIIAGYLHGSFHLHTRSLVSVWSRGLSECEESFQRCVTRRNL